MVAEKFHGAFADVRNFTSITETFPPDQVMGLLNGVLGRLTEAVLALLAAALLAGTTGSRQQRVALVVAPDADARADFDSGRGVLADHGWSVVETAGGDLASSWAAGLGLGSGARR